MYDIIELNSKSLPELQEIAKQLDIPKFEKLMKQDLIYKILDQQALIPPKDEQPEIDDYQLRIAFQLLTGLERAQRARELIKKTE